MLHLKINRANLVDGDSEEQRTSGHVDPKNYVRKTFLIHVAGILCRVYKEIPRHHLGHSIDVWRKYDTITCLLDTSMTSKPPSEPLKWVPVRTWAISVMDQEVKLNHVEHMRYTSSPCTA